ncbi:MAG TPA: dienelactone hydrolase family protein [Stellaceae bacterium]|nr:dienelactone hydrolase family protein [Stellaceae bacterium]
MRNLGGALVAALAWLVAAAPSFATVPAPVDTLADGRSGKIYFTSLTPKDAIEMAKRQSATKVVVDGVLSLPAEAKGPVPAMVIAHGSGGILPSYVLWTEALNRAGIATFVVDSWNGRGITSTRYDQSQVSSAANVADAFFALRLLATHPRIDAKRIGVMGFSRGGFVALNTTLEPLRRAVIGGDLHFAAHVPFYPDCNFRWTAAQRDGAPILMLLGQRDDWTPAAPCLAEAELLKARGVDIRTVVFPNAFHGFDVPGRSGEMKGVPQARNCFVETNLDTFVVRRYDTGQAFTSLGAYQDYVRSCQGTGVHAGGDPEGQRRAPEETVAFLKAVFGL